MVGEYGKGTDDWHYRARRGKEITLLAFYDTPFFLFLDKPLGRHGVRGHDRQVMAGLHLQGNGEQRHVITLQSK